VAIRGTDSLENALTDLEAILTPPSQISPEFKDCSGCLVHDGFLSGWNSMDSITRAQVEAQLADYPNYDLLIVGHSLGAAVANLMV
jgi:Lipase (class 3)